MKFTLIFVVALFAVAAAETNPDPEPRFPILRVEGEGDQESSQEGLIDFGKDFGKLALSGLKKLAKHVGKSLIDKAAQVLTDGLHLKPTKQAQEAFNATEPSTEGIFNATGAFILSHARDLALEQLAVLGPGSQEGIIANLGPFFKIHKAQLGLYYHYNKSIHVEGPSHEGILEGLGGIALQDYGRRIKFGDAGNILIGSFVYGKRQEDSNEGIISDLGSGLLTSAGKLVIEGAAKTAKYILKAAFNPIGQLLKNALWLSRSNYNAYSDIAAPGQEALLHARAQIHQHPEAQKCIDAAERNLTQLFDQYLKNGHSCVDAVHPHGKIIVNNVFDIILDAVKRVDDTYREADNCFDKKVIKNKIVCLDEEVPAQIAVHQAKFIHYERDLADYVEKFSDLNTQFDVCLTKHLGEVRSKVYKILYEFHKCVDAHHRKLLLDKPIKSGLSSK